MKRPTYPIFQTEMPIKGIYQSYREFLDNRPAVTDGFTVASKTRNGKEWRGTIEVTPYYAKANGVPKEIRKVWGFSDGGTSTSCSEARIFHSKLRRTS